jgi:hypothetical protein
MMATTGKFPIELKCCALRDCPIARSGAGNVWQQLT